MRRSYYTYEEQEAYNEGRHDESHNRRNYEHDRYSDEPADQAYFQGRKDEEREERVRQEEREQQEAYERMIMEQREEERRREEEEYNQYLQAQIDQQMEDERAYMEMIAEQNSMPYPEFEPPIDELQPDEMTPEELNATPISEEQLFMDIQEDERNESVDNN